jgi:glutathione S-transferase
MITVHSIVGSPYGRAVMATCLEKGAPYRLTPVIPGQHRAPEHLARHPFGRVPAIDDDGFSLYETQAILRYIDASRPEPPLTPADPKAAARMNQMIGIIDWYVFAPQSAMTIGFHRVVAPRLGVPSNEDAVAASLENAQRCVDVLAGLMADGRPYVAGDSFGLGDLHAAPHLDMLSEVPEGAAMLAGTPITGWLARVTVRPSFTATTWERLLEAA